MCDCPRVTHAGTTATAQPPEPFDTATSGRDPLADDRWWRQAVVYQVYIRSFADANGDGIGDLAGVLDRLPYLRELGVDALWFNPWYPSPMADTHRGAPRGGGGARGRPSFLVRRGRGGRAPRLGAPAGQGPRPRRQTADERPRRAPVHGSGPPPRRLPPLARDCRQLSRAARS